MGRLGLNHRVRDVDGCFPQAHRHRKFLFYEIARELGFKTVNLDNYCGYAEMGEGEEIVGISWSFARARSWR